MSLSLNEIHQTGEFLRSIQTEDGALPWRPGEQWDAWNHTEALMGLTVAGVATGNTEFIAAAERGLDFLMRTQRAGGSWPMLVRNGEVELVEMDTNQTAYVAVGVWHFHLATGRDVSDYWPMVRRALDTVLRAQLPHGPIAWAVNARGDLGDHALLTGSSSILQSVWAAVRLAELQGFEAEVWRACGTRLAEAVRTRPDAFAPHHRHSMDWFYPVLGGAYSAEDAQAHLRARWDEFVWLPHGVRCVNDHPWVTGGETAELALTLCKLGETDRAAEVLDTTRSLREADGGYLTGYVVDDDAHWPQEKTGWTAGAILLAEDAISGHTPAGNFFHDITWQDNA